MQNSEDFVVSENYSESDRANTVMYYFEDCGVQERSRIYRNTLVYNGSSHLSNAPIGNKFVGDNFELDIHCNNYTYMFNDWEIGSNGKLDDQIDQYHTNRNNWSLCSGNAYNIDNHNSSFNLIVWYEHPSWEEPCGNNIFTSKGYSTPCTGLDCKGWPNNEGGVYIEEDKNIRQSLSVYPNPAINTIHIKIKNDSYNDLTVNIYDVYGRLMLTRSYKSNYISKTIKINNLNSGTYILHAHTNKMNFEKKKIIIKR